MELCEKYRRRMGETMSRIGLIAFSVAMFLADAAYAHTGHGFVSSFTSGFSHPFSGLDHLLAMFAVGLLAVQLGGRAIWLVPSAFVVLMMAGALAGFAGLAVPGVEFAIVLSIIAIALPVALALGMPVTLAMLYVGVFAFFHGYAHGAELPAGAGALDYVVGFAAATALIHTLGIAAGYLAARLLWSGSGSALRLAGAAVAAAGVAFFII